MQKTMQEMQYFFHLIPGGTSATTIFDVVIFFFSYLVLLLIKHCVKNDRIQTRQTPNTDTFHALKVTANFSVSSINLILSMPFKYWMI